MEIKPYMRKTFYYETDQMGIIHHANYILWFEEARTDYMEQVGYGYKKAVENGIDFALLYVHCEYKDMVKFGDVVEMHVKIGDIDKMKMTVQYEMINKTTGKVCCTGESGHCFYDNERQRPVALEKKLPQLYRLFLQLSQV